jgi:hypothetical protein
LFVNTAKSEICVIASLSDLGMVDSTIHRSRYTDFLIILISVNLDIKHEDITCKFKSSHDFLLHITSNFDRI